MSGPPGPEHITDNVLRVIGLNAGDLALYHAATAMFTARVAALRGLDVDHGSDARALVRLEPGVAVPVRDVAGRQGFHPYEPAADFSWLIGTGPARLAFMAAPGPARLRLRFYHVVKGYPAGEIGLTVNGAAVAVRWEPIEGQWGVLETAPFQAEVLNVVTLSAPYALPMQFLAPESVDRRQLAVALAALMLLPA